MKLTAALLTALFFVGSVYASEQHKSVFKKLDNDRNGALTTAEAEKAGITSTDFVQLDKDADGVLNIEEFLAMYAENDQENVSSE